MYRFLAMVVVIFTITFGGIAAASERYCIIILPPATGEREVAKLEKKIHLNGIRIAQLESEKNLTEEDLKAIERLKEDVKRCQDRLKVIEPDYNDQSQEEYIDKSKEVYKQQESDRSYEINGRIEFEK